MIIIPYNKLNQIKTTIEDMTAGFIISFIDESFIDIKERKRLKKEGKATDPDPDNFIDRNYEMGYFKDRYPEKKTGRMSMKEFSKFIDDNPFPLSQVDKFAIEHAKFKAGRDFMNLGYKIVDTVNGQILDFDQELRNELQEAIQEETALNIAKKKTIKQLASDLRKKTKEYGVDFERIALTEKMNATNQGIASSIRGRSKEEEIDPDDIEVYKLPNPSACRDCIRLYTVDGVKMRVFKLKELQDNSNIGRKKSEWVPTIGPAHPWCGCLLVEKPAGTVFDEDGNLQFEDDKDAN